MGRSPEEVEQAIRRIEARRPDLGMAAQSMADRLTAGQGADLIHQAAVQEALWWFVPRSCPEGQWAEHAEATAELLTELGMERLAKIATSEQMATVLAAWAEDEDRGAVAYRKAMRDSGVQAPDTPTLAWGSFMGPEEAAAREEVERALGDAIGAGTLKPGSSSWRPKAAAIAERVLTAPLELVPGQSHLAMITTERISMWIDLASPPLRDWRQAVGNRLLSPIDPPADVAAVVAPALWLLELASGHGVVLTPRGNLPRAAVVDAAERFGWHKRGVPRSEADVYPLATLRVAMTRLRLVRRRGERLTLTTKGYALGRDPAELWRLIASEIEDGDKFTRMVAELVGLQLLRGRLEKASLAVEAAPILRQQGWSSPAGLITEDDVRVALWMPLAWWGSFGLLDEERDVYEPGSHRLLKRATLALTPAGEATVLAYLRARATGPRYDFYGSER